MSRALPLKQRSTCISLWMDAEEHKYCEIPGRIEQQASPSLWPPRPQTISGDYLWHVVVRNRPGLCGWLGYLPRSPIMGTLGTVRNSLSRGDETWCIRLAHPIIKCIPKSWSQCFQVGLLERSSILHRFSCTSVITKKTYLRRGTAPHSKLHWIFPPPPPTLLYRVRLSGNGWQLRLNTYVAVPPGFWAWRGQGYVSYYPWEWA